MTVMILVIKINFLFPKSFYKKYIFNSCPKHKYCLTKFTDYRYFMPLFSRFCYSLTCVPLVLSSVEPGEWREPRFDAFRSSFGRQLWSPQTWLGGETASNLGPQFSIKQREKHHYSCTHNVCVSSTLRQLRPMIKKKKFQLDHRFP